MSETAPKSLSDRIDWTLLFLILLLAMFSLAGIYSAQLHGSGTTRDVMMQGAIYAGSIFLFIGMMFFEPEHYQKLTWYLYAFAAIILFALIIAPHSIAPVINGQRSWFVIPGFGTLQPAEFAKITYILSMSWILAHHKSIDQEQTLKTDLWLLVKFIACTSLPWLLIMMQTDLGTGLVYLAIFSAFMVVSGIAWRLIILLLLSVSAIGGTAIYLALFQSEWLLSLGVKPYQISRVFAWLEPEVVAKGEGLQLLRSMRAIGSGQIYGKPYGDREIYIPEAHTDFIFSVIAEQFGFIGASLLIAVFFFLIYHLIQIALRTRRPFDTYVCVGAIAMIAFHVFQNIGMTMQLLPITGIPLPFVSSGGSSLLSSLMLMGLILSIQFHEKSYMFESDVSKMQMK
ncbi:FtsW/RodA/SpoVE family cell cycle protein [Aureibacillus halotolerans]|uniref:Rod shape determining protein RodA n=1 Tax=Aureibacillus halotolerans TaxID=1508390 RepID=A0A4R6U0N4_9BACI|nr:FtsW/RodA/SpoVE family cell cycle protein [Aureibacillus halotolerans]TDQ38782.1 rod shape determining protein RodA [Aureibacillus halotolerans]